MNGVRLGSHYTWNWCAPSRGALLTGKYPTYNGYGGAGSGASGGDAGTPIALPLNWTLLPQVLSSAAVPYACHGAGKWHLGFPSSEYLPENRGFHSWIGYLGGAEDHWGHNTSHGGCPGIDMWNGTTGTGAPARDSSLYPRYSTFIFAERHVNTIMAHPDPEAPLFIYAPFQNAHVPLQVPQRFFDLYTSGQESLCNFSYTSNGRQAFSCLPNKRFPTSTTSNCGCNRLLVAAMMSALDEAIFNITSALEMRGMWNNTLLVVLGDNGGPVLQGHSNAPFRGGKLNWWEGGVRPMAFVSSPLLPRASRGQWYNGTVSETDWFVTFAKLAGAILPHRYALDGRDLWPTLQNLSTPHRNEVLIADHILRVGPYKLIEGGGFEETGGDAWRHGFLRDCMLGTGGGWLAPTPADNGVSQCPQNVYDGSDGAQRNVIGKLSCDDVQDWGDENDRWLCSVPCTPSRPCLFDVVNDPGEHHDLATELPHVAKRLQSRLHSLQKSYWMAPGLQDNGRFCKQMRDNGGYYGPWLDTVEDAVIL